MRLLGILTLAAALSGCGANYVGTVSTGASVAAAEGATVITGPAGLYASFVITGTAAEVLYWMTGAGIYGAMLLDDFKSPGILPAPMKQDRTIVEVDCTKPLPEGMIGNLRCR